MDADFILENLSNSVLLKSSLILFYIANIGTISKIKSAIHKNIFHHYAVSLVIRNCSLICYSCIKIWNAFENYQLINILLNDIFHSLFKFLTSNNYLNEKPRYMYKQTHFWTAFVTHKSCCYLVMQLIVNEIDWFLVERKYV